MERDRPRPTVRIRILIATSRVDTQAGRASEVPPPLGAGSPYGSMIFSYFYFSRFNGLDGWPFNRLIRLDRRAAPAAYFERWFKSPPHAGRNPETKSWRRSARSSTRLRGSSVAG